MLIVTAATSSHFRSLQQLLLGLKRHRWQGKTRVIDLGLEHHQKTWLNEFALETEQVLFSFSEFPGHFRQIRYCAWKPAVIREALSKHAKVLWLDAGCIVKSIKFFQSVDIALDPTRSLSA